jgi:hypothetical protein
MSEEVANQVSIPVEKEVKINERWFFLIKNDGELLEG